jgi:hypothetical protein
LNIGDEEILRESRSGEGSQEERLNNRTEDGYANLRGDPKKKGVAEHLRGEGLVGVINLQREGRGKSLGDRGLKRRRPLN